MKFQTTKLGKQILDEAKKYIVREDICIEATKNTGSCINLLKCNYEGKKTSCDNFSINDEAYCAIFAWSVNKQGFMDGGFPTKIIDACKTKGALDLLNRAKKNKVRVDTMPAPGCTFYKRSSDPKASGHVGIVIAVYDGYLHTIEGNTAFMYKGKVVEGIWGKHYKVEDLPKQGFQFIHFETLFGTSDLVEFEINAKKANESEVRNYSNPKADKKNSLASIPEFVSDNPLLTLGIAVGAVAIGYYAFSGKK